MMSAVQAVLSDTSWFGRRRVERLASSGAKVPGDPAGDLLTAREHGFASRDQERGPGAGENHRAHGRRSRATRGTRRPTKIRTPRGRRGVHSEEDGKRRWEGHLIHEEKVPAEPLHDSYNRSYIDFCGQGRWFVATINSMPRKVWTPRGRRGVRFRKRMGRGNGRVTSVPQSKGY